MPQHKLYLLSEAMGGSLLQDRGLQRKPLMAGPTRFPLGTGNSGMRLLVGAGQTHQDGAKKGAPCRKPLKAKPISFPLGTGNSVVSLLVGAGQTSQKGLSCGR